MSGKVTVLVSEEEQTVWTSRSWDYWALWAVALLSLALNIGLIVSLLNVRRQAGEALQAAAQSLGRLRTSTLAYTFQIEESVPVQVTVPIKEQITVPIDTQLPINTFVDVPVELPLIGSRTISLPIETVIPVKFETSFAVDLTVPISASVPVVLDVPIQIKVADTPFDAALAEAETFLKRFAGDLGVPSVTPTAPRPTRAPTTPSTP